jgi:hypothetical protein
MPSAHYVNAIRSLGERRKKEEGRSKKISLYYPSLLLFYSYSKLL